LEYFKSEDKDGQQFGWIGHITRDDRFPVAEVIRLANAEPTAK
jgi:hypothetical protein